MASSKPEESKKESGLAVRIERDSQRMKIAKAVTQQLCSVMKKVFYWKVGPVVFPVGLWCSSSIFSFSNDLAR